MAEKLQTILDDLANAGEGETTSVGEVLDAFENRSLGVLLALFGALAAIPVIGGLPGAPLVLCAFIMIAIAQSVFAKGGLWAPKRLRNVEIGRDKLKSGMEKAKPWARRIDALVKPRLEWLTGSSLARGAIIAASTLLALSFLPLSLIPWGVGAPAFALVAFGLALLGRDGLFALVGYGFVLATIYLGTTLGSYIVSWMPGSGG